MRRKLTPFEEDKRIWVKGLVVQCPLHTALEDCPLNALRHLPLAQMNAAINRLSDEQIDAIVDIHRQCFHERISKASD